MRMGNGPAQDGPNELVASSSSKMTRMPRARDVGFLTRFGRPAQAPTSVPLPFELRVHGLEDPLPDTHLCTRLHAAPDSRAEPGRAGAARVVVEVCVSNEAPGRAEEGDAEFHHLWGLDQIYHL
jgi:hypothetical protein